MMFCSQVPPAVHWFLCSILRLGRIIFFIYLFVSPTICMKRLDVVWNWKRWKITQHTDGAGGRTWRIKHQNAATVDRYGATLHLSEGSWAAGRQPLNWRHSVCVTNLHGLWSQSMQNVLSQFPGSVDLKTYSPVVKVCGGNTEAVIVCSLSESQLCMHCHYVPSNSVKLCTFLVKPQ